MSPEYKKALEKLVEYSQENEYDHLVEELYSSGHYNDIADQPEFDMMTEEELYAFCINNDFEHIWTSIFELKIYLGSVK